MKKKLILLILALPLFLMISLFTATSTVSLTVKVPVSGIEIIGNDIVYLDFDINETYKVDYAVYPTNAQNQEIVFTTEKVEGFDYATLEYTDGKIVPKSIGLAKVYLTTVDGGYKDSFIVQVDSAKLQSIECSVEKESILVGEKLNISTIFKPANTSNLLLEYSSSDETVVKVSKSGQITGVGRGTAVITVTSQANPAIMDTITINVYQNEPITFVTPNVLTWNHSGAIQMSIKDILDYEYSYKAYDSNGIELAQDKFIATFDASNKNDGRIILNYDYKDSSYIGSIKIVVYALYDGTTVSEECTVSFVNEINVSFDKPNYEFFAGQNAVTVFNVLPEGIEVTFSCILSNSNIQIIKIDDGIITLYANKAGVTKLTLRVTDANTNQYKDVEIDIIVKPKSFIISESAKTFGDENILAVGGKEFDGSDNKVSISISYKESEIGEEFLNNLSFVTDNENVQVDKNGVIKIASGFKGKVSIYGVFKYGDIEYRTTSLSVFCVGDGVNIRNFEELYYTVKNGLPVVLQEDVINDFGIIDGEEFYNQNTVTKIHTTFDDTYYKNSGKLDQAEVMILLEFKNDLYGNGHTINANNVTMQLDDTGTLKADSLFKGPLNFVSMTESASSAVSVKAQDNICYALYDNVTVRNVKLYGCSLTADEEGNYYMTDLEYVGTTVEVMGDNVNISFARIHNGRTVLRVFGHIDDPTRQITVNISNSVLGGAREFIIRMGSNNVINCPPAATPDKFISVRLNGDESITFPAQKAYSKMADAEKSIYDKSFIKTFVNVKNSVFRDAGIFAIGIDSHFSGVYLAQGKDVFAGGGYASFVSSWYNLAKTSYGAKLTFEGEVRMYNWKNIKDIDSSTLIKIVGDSMFATQLEFDVGSMIENIADNPNFKNIIYEKEGERYVHAGIAFFGGGKNYGVFELKNTDKTQFSQFVGYEISLDEVGKGFLASAAGKEKFYFMLHDSTTQFLPETQDFYLNSKNAFDCIYKVD